MSLVRGQLSLTLQRAVSRATDAVSTSISRLASGQRINRPSDDAASMAVATGLNLNTRVFTQGIRNINDGQSLLSIADAALGSLGSITGRLQELAAQSANGSLGVSQRLSLQSEADSLVSEFNRVALGTKFNGLGVVDATLSELRIQAGYGSDGGLAFGLAGQLSRTAGTGTFIEGSTSPFSLFTSISMLQGDLNGDGFADIVSSLSSNIQVLLSNGDGTFSMISPVSSPAGSTYFSALADVNGDGRLDLVAPGTNQVSVQLGNGNGTFAAATNLALSAGVITQAVASDLNGDGIVDIAATNATTGTVSIRLGTGGGSFAAAVDYAAGAVNASLVLGDFNGDGIPDLASSSGGLGRVNVLIGNGNGSFQSSISWATGSGAGELIVGDYNFDGRQDLAVVTGLSTISILQGAGNGTMSQIQNIAVSGSIHSLRAADFNSDGVTDFVISTNSGMQKSILLGSASGSFTQTVSYSTAAGATGFAVADFTGDGVPDIYSAFGGSSGKLLTARTEQITTIGKVNITTASVARSALSTLEGIARRIALERGAIGANQSRLSSALSALTGARDAGQAASSRITDIDVAQESASLIRSQILQQSSTALLAQVNSSQSYLLDLLRPG